MSRETKRLTFQVKATGVTTDESGQEFGHIEAYGAIFNNVDEGNDRILPGAFTRTIKNSKARAKAREKKYILKMLWQHDDHELIGGWYDMTEDATGLLCKGDIALATQRGREFYALAKAGMIDDLSIIYDVPAGGAKYDKSGVRDLSELRLFSVDPVTFPMNDATYIAGVKAMQRKGASGKTTWPLGNRKTTWDNDAAYGRIVAQFTDSDGNLDTAGMKSVHFWFDDSAPENVTSYKLLFCDVVGGAIKAMPRAIFACAGAHGVEAADIPEGDVDGVKAKIETYYSRMAKEFDDDSIVAPWKDDGKARRRPMQRKDFNDHYRLEQIKDWLYTDFQNLVCALQQSVIDIFSIGDEPQDDVVNTILEGTADGSDDTGNTLGFIDALKAYVQKGIDLDVSNYMQEIADQYGYDIARPYYYYMSRQRELARKASYAADATTGGFTSDHVDSLRTAASKAMKKVQAHADALHDAADSVSSMVNGDSKALKAGRAFSAANVQALQDHADGLHDAADSLTKSVQRQMKSVQNVADDLATILQGSEGAYGTDSGNAGTNQEGKASTSSRAGTRATSPRPSQKSDTANEEEIDAALSSLRAIRQKLTQRAS